jgi:hypothetical protein
MAMAMLADKSVGWILETQLETMIYSSQARQGKLNRESKVGHP